MIKYFYPITTRLFGLVAGLIIFLSWPAETQASHAMGADLTYECIGGDSILVRLTVYRDCSGSPLNDDQPLFLGSASCGIADTVILADRVAITTLPVICPAQQALSSCDGGILPGAEEHIYEARIALDQQCTDWRIGWALCCRNGAITNSTVSPSTTDIYIEATIDNTVTTCNESPIFTNDLVPYLCVNQPFVYDAGATDPDGDSLAYELVDPLDYDFNTALSSPVPYNAGFSFNNPMSTSTGFNFDPLTGQISFTPNMIQVGIVAILVKEYRNGQLIATTMRDLQMIVLNCGNVPPVINQPTNISGGQFNGNTFSVCVGNTLTFNLNGLDPDGGLLSFCSTPFTDAPGAFYQPGINLSQVSALYSFSPTIADTGEYYLELCISDDGCPYPQIASKRFRIIVEQGEILPQQIINFCPSTQDSVNPVTNIPPATNASYTWIPATGVSNPGIVNPRIISPTQPTTYTLIQTVPGDCPKVQTFLITPGADIVVPSDTLSICQGDTVQVPVSVTFPGAPATYTLLWAPSNPTLISNPSSNAPLLYPNTSTDFIVQATTATCQYTAEIRVEVTGTPQLDIIPDPLICYGDTVTLAASGTNLSNATIQWFPTTTLTNPTSLVTQAAPLSTTSYELKAENQCGADSITTTVNVAQPLNLNANTEDILCNGEDNGQINVVPFGGQGPYNYTLFPNPSGNSFPGSVINLPPNTYRITALDQAGCEDTLFVTLSEPPPLLLNLDTLVNVNCFGENDGRIELSASGGTPDYGFSVNGPSGPYLNSGVFPGLTSGTYTLSVQDDNGCTVDIPGVLVDQPANPVSITIDNVVNASCNDSLGQIAITANGGSGAYEFLLNGNSIVQGGTNYTFLNLPPATYTVAVVDTNGCEADSPVQIIEFTDPVAALDLLQLPSCFGENSGRAEILLQEGVPPYNISFEGSPFTPATSDTAIYDSLGAGWYTFQVEDQNDCIYSLDFEVTQPDTFLFQLGAYTPPLCVGGNDGEALFLGFGGTPPYQYQLATMLQDTGYFSPLTSGTFPFTLIDDRGCEVTDTIVLVDPPPLLGFAAVQNITCPGAADGVISLSATGGTPNYEYSLDSSSFVEGSTFPNLLAGTYTFVVQDDNGCRDTLDATVLEPDPLVLTAGTVEDVDCFGAATGSATLQGQGGTSPYTYALPGEPFTSSNVVDSLPEGTYVILMQDINGCLTDVQVTIEEPFALRGEVESQPVLCFGDSNGIAEVFMNGGTMPYGYEWSNGETGRRATQLPPGNPTVTITDANGCTYAISAEVLEPPEMSFDTTALGDVSCFAGTDGFVLAVAQGGTPPYNYDWSNGSSGTQLAQIGAGAYIITVTDSNGCPIMDTLVVNEPDPIELEVSIQNAICGTPSGSIEIMPSGGTGDLQILWENNETTRILENLLGGPDVPPYNVLITDENGCSISESIRLEESGEPSADFLHAYQPLDSFLRPLKGVQFINVSLEGVAYLWDFGDGHLSEELNPLHVYEDPGQYEVTLVVFDPFFSCPDTARQIINLLPPGDIFVPNVFSPNGDGHNDTWAPKGAGVVRSEARVYSRWGELIITLPSLDHVWNGDHPRTGGPAQEGVYVWVVTALLNDGSRVERYGTVTLVH